MLIDKSCVVTSCSVQSYEATFAPQLSALCETCTDTVGGWRPVQRQFSSEVLTYMYTFILCLQLVWHVNIDSFKYLNHLRLIEFTCRACTLHAYTSMHTTCIHKHAHYMHTQACTLHAYTSMHTVHVVILWFTYAMQSRYIHDIAKLELGSSF